LRRRESKHRDKVILEVEEARERERGRDDFGFSLFWTCELLARMGCFFSSDAKKDEDDEIQISKDKEIVFVLGGPGSGKGTQCDLMVEKYGFGHFSAGDLLRAEVASGSDLGKELESIMKEGKLVPSSVTIRLLKKAIAGFDGNKVLVDGFPRALDQATEFEEKVLPAKMVLFFDCPENVLQKRLLKRAKTSGRADDNIDTIKKRFDTFKNESMPAVEHYEKLGRCKRISAVPSAKKIFTEVDKVMKSEGFTQE